ncbi:LPS-assembly protein LptD [Geovibrio thiophilus]|uniref:LPS-assembly protein LptD n=1 Tax=Geovibrio thiophilus TaxID=139438 RepID=A0A410JZB6_9BACT|nr:LptA/OstA family protein [Geovibrio thiophilus]QAR33536.1 LPS-assembly protein LptD [Geovibrio thiophilus]
MIRLLLIILLITYTSASAAELLLPSADTKVSNITIESDHMLAPDNTTFEATGNVVIMKDNSTLTADKVIYNRETGLFDASGNVRLREGGNFFDCTNLLYDFAQEKGTFIDVKGFVEPYHYLEAEKFERTGQESFLIEKGRFTTCPGEVPDWSFTASRATMDIGNYIKATNTTGWIKSVPVLYTPYMIYPIKKDRESGLLIPKLGSNSERGSMLGLKYFRDINVDKDATIGTNLYTSGIVHYLGEYRYAKSMNENLYIYGEFIDDWESESDKRSRYLFYQDSNFKIGDNTEIYIEADYVSDYRYLRDIADTEMVDDYDNPDNKFYADVRLIHRTEYADFGIRFKNDMQFTDIDDGYKKTEVYRLPNLFVRKNLRKGFLGLNYTADLDHVLYREKTIYPSINGADLILEDEYERMHLTTEIYTPINLKIATFKPYAEIIATKWDGIDEAPNVHRSKGSTIAQINADDDSIERLTYRIGYEVSLNEIYRKYDKFSHSVYNTFRYEQIPELDHSAIPERIEGDLIEGTKSYTYFFKNYFDADKWNLDASLEQSYDAMQSGDRLRPIIAKANYTYDKMFNAYVRHDYDHSDANTALLHQRVSFSTGPVTFSEEYLYEDPDYTDETENTSLEFSVSLSFKKFDFAFKTQTSGINSNLSLDNLRTISNSFYGTYKSGCWHMGMSVTQKEYNPIDDKGGYSGREQIIYFVIGLQGLGTFRSPVSSTRSSDRVDNFY